MNKNEQPSSKHANESKIRDEEWSHLIKLRKSLEAALIKKAHEDKNFEHLLLTNPKAALKELHVQVPDGMKIEVIEETGDSFKFIYPKEVAGMGLNEAIVADIANGKGRNGPQ